MAQQQQIRRGTMSLQVRSLASLSGLRIWCGCELWCRSQMQLGSDIAVAVMSARGNSSDQTPSLGTCICCRCGPKKRQKKKKRLRTIILLQHGYNIWKCTLSQNESPLNLLTPLLPLEEEMEEILSFFFFFFCLFAFSRAASHGMWRFSG